MNRDLYARVSEIFLRAADLPAAERSQFLDEACGIDTELRRRVEGLLLHDEEPERVTTPRARLLPSRKRSPSPTTALGRALSRLFDNRLRRRVAVIVSAVILLGFAVWSRWQLNAEIRSVRAEELETVLDTGAVAVDLWIKERQAEARFWADDPRVRESMEELTDLATKHLSKLAPESPHLAAAKQILYESAAQSRLAEVFQEIPRTSHRWVGVQGFDRRGFVLADSKEWIGRRISAEFLHYLQVAGERETVFVPPTTDSRSFAGFEPSGPETAFTSVAAAVLDRDGAYVGVLSFVNRAEDDFLRILSTGRIGRTGETFAFDAGFRMLSESRFTEQLQDLGLLPDDEMGSSARFHVRDPGRDLTVDREALESTASWPATLLVRKAVGSGSRQDPAEQHGVITEPYRSYRGVEVIGAWRWFEEYGFGLATEMELSEIHAPFRRIDAVISVLLLALAVSAGAGLFSSFAFVRWRQRFGTLQRKLGQYHLSEKIGEGGMGEVFLAEHQFLKRPTAVKILKPEVASEETVGRFEREVRAASRLTHPSTVEIYDYGRTPEGTFYYAMEYVPGLNLAELISSQGALPPGRAVHILKQVCASLHEAHQHGLIHRDIKPLNLMICERGAVHDVVKVLDFGLVKVVDDPHTRELSLPDRIMGTPPYMAPERLRNPSSVDARSDIYSVGAVAYNLLTGENVFRGNTTLELLSQILESDPEPLSDRSGLSVPPELEELVLSCLAKDPARRPQSAADLLKALESLGGIEPWTQQLAAEWWRRQSSAA